MKQTLEKLGILKQTFGDLAKQISKIDDDAYQLIPMMKQVSQNITKYKLNELKLECISENFF